MNPKELTKAIVQAFLIIVLLIGLFEVFVSIQSVVFYIIIAAVVSLIGRPITLLLKKIKFSNTLSSVTTIAILMMTFFGIVRLLFPVIFEQAKNLSLLNVTAFEATATQLIDELSLYLSGYGIDLQSWVDRSLAEFDYSFLPDTLNTILNGLSGFTIGVFSVIFISFFFLKDSGLLEKMVMVFVADKNTSRVEKSILSIKNLLSRYFIGLQDHLCIYWVCNWTVDRQFFDAALCFFCFCQVTSARNFYCDSYWWSLVWPLGNDYSCSILHSFKSDF